MPRRQARQCYDVPQYWDLAFRSETKLEADFIEGACRRFGRTPTRRLLEPGCGGGRLVVEMAARGYEVWGYDLHPACVAYSRRRLRRRGLRAEVWQADMTRFVCRPPADAAFCTFNTFRHLTSEEAARSHLQTMAQSLRPSGIYILGFHLLPPDAEETCLERWSARHARTRVSMTLRVLDCDRRRRLETIRFSLRVRSGARDVKLQSDETYRLYTARQVRQLFAAVPEFELCEVFDFWYDLDHPVRFDDELGDALFVLRRRADAGRAPRRLPQ